MNIKKWDNSDDYYLPINGETYSLSPGTNIDFNSKKLRYSFSSLNTPSKKKTFFGFFKKNGMEVNIINAALCNLLRPHYCTLQTSTVTCQSHTTASNHHCTTIYTSVQK